LYGCEIWSLTLRQKRRQRVFENRVLRRTFWPIREEVTGGVKKNILRGALWSVLLAKYYSVDQIKEVMGKACGMYGRQERCTQGFGGEMRGKESTWKTCG
jgi:hypothetical protein